MHVTKNLSALSRQNRCGFCFNSKGLNKTRVISAYYICNSKESRKRVGKHGKLVPIATSQCVTNIRKRSVNAK